MANNARRQLKRKTATSTGKKSSGRGLSPIKDERQIKRPNSAYFRFSIERRESGDFKGIALGEAARLVTKEWNDLSAGEKKVCSTKVCMLSKDSRLISFQKYEDLHQADKERYVREYERAYGHPPPSATKAKA